MTDLAELKRLAEAAGGKAWECYSEPDVGMPETLMELTPTGHKAFKLSRTPIEPLPDEHRRFIAAANPAAILALIAEVERLREEKQAEFRRGIEAAAMKSTSFLVGAPVNGVPLRNPMPHEIAAAIRAIGEGA